MSGEHAAGTAVVVAPLVASASAWINEEGKFIPTTGFNGRRPGCVFKLGSQGLGYYEDKGFRKAPLAQGSSATGAGTETKKATSDDDDRHDQSQNSVDPTWIGMRTVAQIRRELNIGAPREVDSLYGKIERAPRQFNPLRVPKALQASLPYKTKPKLEPKRKRKTLDQKRAVVHEPEEKKMISLIQQLNSIRNEKAAKRRATNERRKLEQEKKQAQDLAARKEIAREERKKRYVEQGQAAKRAAMAQEGGKYSAKKRKRE